MIMPWLHAHTAPHFFIFWVLKRFWNYFRTFKGNFVTHTMGQCVYTFLLYASKWQHFRFISQILKAFILTFWNLKSRTKTFCDAAFSRYAPRLPECLREAGHIDIFKHKLKQKKKRYIQPGFHVFSDNPYQKKNKPFSHLLLQSDL